MKISIITPSFNQGQFIEQNIESVLNQNYPDVEHIVIDGGSTDGTLAVLEKYSHLKWISERDKGQADALNKGLALSTGNIIGWINSDDYYESNVFNLVISQFSDPDVQWVVGDLTMLYETKNSQVAQVSPIVSYAKLIDNPDIVRQQCTFFRKKAIVDAGSWNPDLYMVMDFDLWIRLAKKSAPVMLSHNLAYFRLHDDQKTSNRNLLRQCHEITGILKREKAAHRYVVKLQCKKYWQWFKRSIKNIMGL